MRFVVCRSQVCGSDIVQAVRRIAVRTGCFFFKQKTAYEMRMSDWSSDVCSSDLVAQMRDLMRDGGSADMVGGHDEPPAIAQVAARGAASPAAARSEERRVGKACVSTCRSRGSPYT